MTPDNPGLQVGTMSTVAQLRAPWTGPADSGSFVFNRHRDQPGLEPPAHVRCSSCRVSPARDFAGVLAFCPSCLEWVLRAVDSGALTVAALVARYAHPSHSATGNKGETYQ